MPALLHNQNPQRLRRSGFTLIEILVVVAIIVILAAIGISVGMSVISNSKNRSTHNSLKTLEGIMKDYLAAGNAEPTPASTTTWVADLRANPSYAKKLDGFTTDTTSGQTTILDSWGHAIQYVPYNTGTQKEGYFQSAGPDGTFGTTDDLYSYDP